MERKKNNSEWWTCRPLFGAYLFSAGLVDGLEVLVNALSCVLCSFPAFANMSEIIVIVIALHANGPFHHFWSYLSWWGCVGSIFLLKCFWVLTEGQRATS